MARNAYLEDDLSAEESGSDTGYDSEAAELRKAHGSARRGVKRRRLSHASSGSEAGSEIRQIKSIINRAAGPTPNAKNHGDSTQHTRNERDEDFDDAYKDDLSPERTAATRPQKPNSTRQKRKPGVVYLSSLPPYLKPSALRNLLAQRGFEPVTRLFLTPSSKHKHSSKKSSRQLYSEGWVEFASKKTARLCAEALNAQQVGGKKGGFYYDDLWNMKYLRGMAWEELMAGIREERREEEGRRDEERRKIATATKAFVEGVEQGRRLDGIKRKKKLKVNEEDEHNDTTVKRTWRQHGPAQGSNMRQKSVSGEAEQVLTRIF